MRRWAARIALVVLVLAMAPSGFLVGAQDGVEDDVQCAPGSCASEAKPSEYVPGELLVRFRPILPKERSEQVMASEGAVSTRRIEPLDVDVVRLRPGLSVEEAVERFSAYPEVEYAEPNYILHAAVLIDDPGLTNQWAPQMIDAPQAWETTAGDPSVVIAVVDTGVDNGHSELASNIWQNPGEIAGDGLDNDGNGYVDDIQGWDFVNTDPDPLDDHGHGTHVAGVTAAADNDIGAGLVGICPYCTIMPVKVMDALGSGPLDRVASGITYATDEGAAVINLSLGGATGTATLENAVDYAWNAGVVVVAAAGNDGADDRFYPAAYDNVMAVAATNQDDHRSCFSNYGNGFIDVAAPGEHIHSTYLQDESGTDRYAFGSGTSAAAPHVSGLAGLLISQDPGRSNAQVRNLIEITTEDLGPLGTDAFFGTGRINADRALKQDDTPTTPPTVSLSATYQTSSGYAHARKLARDGSGTLHLAWHSQEEGEYRILYATSADDGLTWSVPHVVFTSAAETYHPALALDNGSVYIAFPSMDGAAYHQTFFTEKPLQGSAWSPPVALIGGTYHAVRPDLFVDPSNGNRHVVASSLDDERYVYYRAWDNETKTWGVVHSVDPNPGFAGNSRYATVHANGDKVYIATRTVDQQSLFTYFYLHTLRSEDGGDTWLDQTKISSYQALYGSEYGVSLAGIGDRLYMAYEVGSGVVPGGGLFFRRFDGTDWSDYLLLETSGLWPSITQADDGQAWMMWEDDGSLLIRHYDGSAWESSETLLESSIFDKGFYPNLKLGTNDDLVEWVYTSCKGVPFTLAVDSRPVPTPPAESVWYLAEGFTGAGFTTFILIQNPNPVEANVQVTYMLQGGGVVSKWVTVPGNSRYTIEAHDPAQVGPDAAFSTKLAADQPIIVERAMYWPNAPSTHGGHVTTGVTAPATTWYLAEGYTRTEFKTFILIQNPNAAEANVDVTYMLQGGGEVNRSVTVPGNSRHTIEAHDPAQVGPDAAFSTRLDSDVPIIAERAMYFHNDGHVATAVPGPQNTWYLAEGYTGAEFKTFILIQNPNAAEASVQVTYMLQGGGEINRSVTVPGNSRYTIEAHDPAQVGPDAAFSTKLDSDVPIIAERAIYWPNGATTVGGHNTAGATTPAATWNLAEGYTGPGFATYVLIQNPNAAEANVDVTYMLQGGGQVNRSVTVPGNSRYTIEAHDPAQVGPDAAFSTKLDSDVAIIAERAMYWPNAGHCTTAVSGP
jgi:thermitase